MSTYKDYMSYKAKKVMGEFSKGKLHSGKSDKIVTNPDQAKAILMSYARKHEEK